MARSVTGPMISAEKSFQLCRKCVNIMLALPVGQGERTSLRSMTRQIVSGFHAGDFFYADLNKSG